MKSNYQKAYASILKTYANVLNKKVIKAEDLLKTCDIVDELTEILRKYI